MYKKINARIMDCYFDGTEKMYIIEINKIICYDLIIGYNYIIWHSINFNCKNMSIVTGTIYEWYGNLMRVIDNSEIEDIEIKLCCNKMKCKVVNIQNNILIEKICINHCPTPLYFHLESDTYVPLYDICKYLIYDGGVVMEIKLCE